MENKLSNHEVMAFSDPALMAEPHAFLANLRETEPVCEVTDVRGSRIFLVTSYALIAEATKRIEDFSSKFEHLLVAGDSKNEEVARILSADDHPSGLLLTSDEPAHQRYRALVNIVFTQGRIANLAPIIERIADELIDAMLQKNEADFVNEFAVLLPTYVIADILGLQREDYHRVRTWSDSIIRLVSRMGTPEAEIAAAKDVVEFRRFLRETIRERRKKPQDDLISNLVNVRVDGLEPLNDDEAVKLAMEIAVAGNETTRNTMMSGLVQLLRRPDQLHALATDPSVVRTAVEEMLRYEAPATSMWRIATRDTELGGVMIPKGSEVLLRFDAANRDPSVFKDPEKFDIRRDNAHLHFAFGAPGIHRCLGQMLARKELAIAMPRLLSRLHNLRAVSQGSDLAYWPGLLHRGIGALRIAYDPAPSEKAA